jgi:hypothetical protein
MSSEYIINFSDSTKPTITVPPMPPGINAVDTSLNLVGRGYPDYGRKIAENFVHLLENFASPFPGPRQPIEGQLWYDTTDPYNKVLRVRDGAVWVNASGIYQQGSDPRTSASQPTPLKTGDIWVDTSNLQLKIYGSGNWITVGPMSSGSEKTGIENEVIEDSSGNDHPVIKVWAKDLVVAVITAEQFTPRIGIPGFSVLLPGINLRNTAINDIVPILNGTASSSKGLEVSGVRYSSDKFLRKDDSSFRGQVISGNIFFKTPADTSGEGKYGVVINNLSSVNDLRYIQFYKNENDAIILNNDANGSIFLKVNDGATLVSAVEVNSEAVSISVPVQINGEFTVTGNHAISNELTVGTTATIGVDLFVNNSVNVKSDITSQGIIYADRRDNVGNTSTGAVLMPTASGQYDIGDESTYFNRLYVNEIGTTASGTTVYGKVVGPATYLENGAAFGMQGQLTSPTLVFGGNRPINNSEISTVSRTSDVVTIQTISTHELVNGYVVSVFCQTDPTFNVTNVPVSVVSTNTFTYDQLGYLDVSTTSAVGVVYPNPYVFDVSLTPAAISDQTSMLTVTNAMSMLVLNEMTNTLGQVSQSAIASSITPPGTIMGFGHGREEDIPDGWLLCNGQDVLKTNRTELFAVIGTDFGGTDPYFKVPNYRDATIGSTPIYYIIKY